MQANDDRHTEADIGLSQMIVQEHDQATPNNEAKPLIRHTQDEFFTTTATKTSTYQRWTEDGWAFEIGCWIFSLLCLAGIVALLLVYDGKSAEPLPYGITLNTLVSILAVLCRLSLLSPVTQAISQLKWMYFKTTNGRRMQDFQEFDDCSRGLWGSRNILRRLRYWPFAPAGAILMIMFVAIEPFTQQTVTYRSVLVAQIRAETATIPRTTYYDVYDRFTKTNGGALNLDTPMQAAILSGLMYGNTTLTAISPVCSTGNCTFPPYATLGVCAKSVNLTDQITQVCGSGDYDTCNYTLPGGALMIKDATEMRNVGMFHTSEFGTYDLRGNLLTRPINSTAFADEKPFVLIDFYTIWNPSNANNSRLMHASETILRVCVQVFNTTVSKGEANTSVTQWYTNFTNVAADPQLPESGLWATLPDGQKFRFGAAPYYMLVNSLRKQLNGTFGTSVTGGGGNYPTSGMQGIVTSIYNPPYDRAAIDLVATNLAMSMTNQMRLANGSIEPAQGVAQAAQTFVQVQWPWLAFVSIAVILTILFLLCVMLYTRRVALPVWKASALAAFFLARGDNFYNGAHTTGSMTKQAEKTAIRIIASDERWMVQRLPGRAE